MVDDVGTMVSEWVRGVHTLGGKKMERGSRHQKGRPKAGHQRIIVTAAEKNCPGGEKDSPARTRATPRGPKRACSKGQFGPRGKRGGKNRESGRLKGGGRRRVVLRVLASEAGPTREE